MQNLPGFNGAMMKRFANWEKGFDMFEAGHPIEHCHVSNRNVAKSLVEGWNAAKCVAELAADTQAALVFKQVKNRFSGMML